MHEILLTVSIGNRPVDEIRDTIEAGIDRWMDEQLDDVSLMVMRYRD